MNSGKTIFAQLMDFISPYEFRRCVEHYHGNYKIKSFSCWDQFLTMVFAPLTYRESLRDIEAPLRAQPAKLYHTGICSQISRNTLAHANQIRDWRIYASGFFNRFAFCGKASTSLFFTQRSGVIP